MFFPKACSDGFLGWMRVMTKRGIQPVASAEATFASADDGSLIVRDARSLGSYPGRVTERLQHWAETTPANVLFAARSGQGWRTVTYGEAWDAARAIGQALLDRGLLNRGLLDRRLAAGRPGLMLWGNEIEPARLRPACPHAGSPFVRRRPATALASTVLARLAHSGAPVDP